MPKHGQRQVDAPGRNDPSRSQDITTGTYKKQETFREQAARHEDPGKTPPTTKAPRDHPQQGHTLKSDSRIQTQLPGGHTGSESNAHGGRKSSVHESHQQRQPEATAREGEDYDRDLRPADRAGQNIRLDGSPATREGHTAYDLKHLHARLPDFADDELRAIQVLPEGTRLEQGATYIDLAHRDRGEFVAMGGMEAGPDNYYVPKKETDYVTWNRLVGVTTPARLDRAE